MQINEFLNSVCEQIKYKPIRNTIAEELKDHIEDKKEELIEMGQNEEEAEKDAVEQMGDAEIIGKELNKVHRHVRCRGHKRPCNRLQEIRTAYSGVRSIAPEH